MQIKTGTLLASMALPLISASSVRAEDRMRAGLWENTVTSGGKTVTKTHCVTSDEADKTNASVKSMREATGKAIAKTGNCTLKDFSLEGNKLSSVMVCGATSFAHTTIYRGDAFETTTTTTSAAGTKVTLMKGRRLGACP
jgi:hypothetical protein